MDNMPQVLLFDDLHEANARALEFIAYLVRTLVANDKKPLMVMATIRSKASPSADALAAGEDLGMEPQNIAVGTLSREDVAKIIFELVGDSRGARLLARRLHKETEGNAYFVTEFLRS